ncbi:right-handed parallel beta-helix repeat-containing protein [Neptunomonas qingdaonensis]|uniref:Nitrous oxidase accessory protein NosD, contains tandem CASH domains n=1 Tax=Neptunomonas qingdaonensis TaxID=1045558 RepID=A0A1I2UVD5_9GAMM|nr:right-handed parallel beta-helix repeat-containing protein [Neptunomonas qingdaonensis]SFG79777.1 Nitrous oxidase accessory protein NosD, contains tandem CASH domains [Neptunomonas qingdaonensis]
MANHFSIQLKKCLHLIFIFFLLSIFVVDQAYATTRKVPIDHATIQAAINASSAGDMVWVAQGTYTENITVKPGIKLEGGYKSDYSARNWNSWPSIIDGNQAGSVVIGAQGATLDGFTLRNGKANFGAGIFLEHASMTIKNNTIENNTADNGGGGIYISKHPKAPPYTDIENNTIRKNKVTSDQGGTGGGILLYLSNTGIRITNNTIGGAMGDGNTARWGGAGIATDQTPIFTIERNIISHNVLEKGHGGGLMIVNGTPNATVSQNKIHYNSVTGGNLGGGIFLLGGTYIARNEIKGNSIFGSPASGGGIFIDSAAGTTPPRIENNFILANIAEKGGGIFIRTGTNIIVMNNSLTSNLPDTHQSGGGIYIQTNASCILQNNILWGNGDDFHEETSGACTLDHNDIEDGDSVGQNGNISADPLFVNYDDLHISKSSPVVNAGRDAAAPSIDYDGDARSGSVDIGADEIISEATPCPFVKAAHASYLDPHIGDVRQFRDKHLLTNGLGRQTVRIYYEHSGSLSNFMDTHEWARIALRVAVTPVVFAIVYPSLSAIFFILLIGMGIVLWKRRKVLSRKAY